MNQIMMTVNGNAGDSEFAGDDYYDNSDDNDARDDEENGDHQFQQS